MSVHLEKAVKNLKKRILALGTRVEENVRLAVRSVVEGDENLARQAIDNDEAIDQLEVDVEEEGLKMLALYQPVAVDLRFIVSVLKINNDLERIGDVAVNIAERALFLAQQRPIDLEFDFVTMADKAQSMLKRSLDALVSMDTVGAKKVCADDDEVDAMNRGLYDQIHGKVWTEPEDIRTLTQVLSVSRHLERIADLATNIAEDVIYMVSGEIVRHHVEDYLAADTRQEPSSP